MSQLKSFVAAHLHQLSAAFMALVAALCFMVATPSQANAQNIDINAAFGWQGMILDDHRDDGHGPMFTISVGYRFMDWLGVYYEQDLGGLIWDNPGPDFKIFSGASIVSIRGFLILSNFELWGKLGIGAFYTADSDGDAWDEGWFAFRIGIGGTYMFTQKVGAGLDFSYTLGAGDHHVIDDTVHLVSLKLHVSFRF